MEPLGGRAKLKEVSLRAYLIPGPPFPSKHGPNPLKPGASFSFPSSGHSLRHLCPRDMAVTNSVGRARRSPDFSLLFPCNNLPVDPVALLSLVEHALVRYPELCKFPGGLLREEKRQTAFRSPSQSVRHSGLPSRILRTARHTINCDWSGASPAITYPPGQTEAQDRLKFYLEKYKRCDRL